MTLRLLYESMKNENSNHFTTLVWYHVPKRKNNMLLRKLLSINNTG